MKRRLFVGAIFVICFVLFATLVSANSIETEKAGKEIDKAMTSLPSGVAMILEDRYQEVFGNVDFTTLVPSEGYRVHTLSAERITKVDKETKLLDELLDEEFIPDYLYYLNSAELPTILVTMKEEGNRVSMKKAGGFAGCYAETRALLKRFVEDAKIRIYEYWFDQYVLTAEIEGKRYAIPFDASQHLLKEYQAITDYRQLPTEKEFLEAMFAENERVKEEHCKYIEKYGKDAILFGSYQVRPTAHITE